MCPEAIQAGAPTGGLLGSGRAAADGPLVRAVLWYQRVREGRPSPCRFFPSCSEYSVEALRVHGSRRGLWLTVRRLVRCRPCGPSGFDPVPERHDTGHDMRMARNGLMVEGRRDV